MNKTRPLDNRYEIEIELGQGFFASVYRARNLRPDHIPKIVALKVFKTNFLDPPERDERFIKEASIIQDITHDHIVRIYDARTTAAGDICYIVMQYIEGQSLQQRLERERLPWQQARFVLDCLTEAIEYLHTRQIVHGDIKPSNIMIDRDGDLAYLLDLGLARVIGYDNLQTRPDIDVNGNPQMPPGTIFYMAPELWKGQPPTPATDLYALAATTFEMLTGRKLIDLNHFSYKELVDRHCTKAHDLEPLVEAGLSHLQPIFEKALHKRPEYRYRTVRDFYEALKEPETTSFAAPDWGLRNVPSNRLLDGSWRIFSHPEKIQNLQAQGVCIWAGTDAGLIEWRQSEALLFTTADGLPHPTVSALAINHGNLWIGTHRGLCWGSRPPFKRIGALQGVAIRALATTPSSSKVWACSPQSLVSLDQWGDSITEHNLSSNPDVSLLTGLFAESDGRRVWVLLSDRLIRLDHRGRQQQVFYAGDRTGFPSGEVLAVTESADRRIWVLTSGALAYYQGGRWILDRRVESMSGGFLVSEGNNIWYGHKNGLFRYTHIERTWKPLADLENVQACYVHRDRIYVATGTQVTRLREDGKTAEDLKLPPAPLDNDIHALANGVGDELWIGSRRGLTYIHGDSWTLLPWSSLPTKFSGLKRGPITALDYSIYDNTLFGAIRGRDLFYLKGGHWDEIPLPLEIARIHALSVGSNGLVWLSTDAGLWSLEERHRFHQVVGGGAGILCTTQVGEEIWCGTESGVLTIHSSKGVRRKGLFAHRVWDLEPTMDGSVWAGTSDGAYRFTHGRWHALPRLHGARTHTIHQAGDGALWFGTDQGIMRFDGFGIYWASRANHRLPHDTVRSIAETSRGMIWIGTQGGLVRFQA